MKKIKKALQAIIAIIKNPWLLNHVLSDDSFWIKKLQKEYKIDQFPLIDIKEIAPDFKEELAYFTFLDGGSLPTDIALLKKMCRKYTDCSYFEIGTWRGESVANVAATAKECYTLNLSKKDMLSLGLSSKYADLIGFLSKDNPKITQLIGNSFEYNFKALNKQFDVVFIDGDHHYKGVKNDTQKIFEHCIHENSIVVWHDYGYSPERIRPEVIAGILDGVPLKFHKNLYHVANTMCAIFIKGNYKTAYLNPPVTPTKLFKVTISDK